jgi:sugar lactone lactonase YvrE
MEGGRLMRDTLRAFTDRLLGRGSAAITVPVMDGALKANRVLDEAEVAAELPGIDDIASDGTSLVASAGANLWRVDGNVPVLLRKFDTDISAIAVRGRGLLAVALGGKQVRVMHLNDDTLNDFATLDSAASAPLVCVNALAFDGDDQLVFSEGSQRNAPDAWCRDLMELGKSGRVCRWNHRTGTVTELARGLAYAYGVLVQGDSVNVSESWRHRVTSIFAHAGNARSSLLAELPCYPSRMTPAADGGYWLSCFVSRTQLVEFVLREPAYRERMLAEVDPRYWIAPTLSSGHSFLEPLQGAGVKQMGVLKPWAPPRSYGLVLRVTRDGRLVRSMHSQVDGKHHGITGVAEHRRRLYVASKGSGKLLSVPIEGGLEP